MKISLRSDEQWLGPFSRSLIFGKICIHFCEEPNNLKDTDQDYSGGHVTTVLYYFDLRLQFEDRI